MTSTPAQRIRIGEVGMAFLRRHPRDLPSPFDDFAGDFPCTCTLEVRDEPGLPTDGQSLLCHSGSWSLFARGDGFRYEGYAPPLHGRTPVMQADMSADWRTGVLRVDPRVCPPEARLAPVATPLGELLLMVLLTLEGGLYVHAASAIRGDEAAILLGRSGAGKTTLSGLAADRGACTLSDDRTVLRFAGGRLVAHGTPFHGTGRRWSNASAPVGELHFLEHAAQTQFEPLPTAEAAARLASLAFSPFWSRRGLGEMLRLSAQAVELAPSYRLRFTPDPSAVEALDAARQAHRRSGHRD